MRAAWIVDSLKPGGAEQLAARLARCPPARLELDLVALQAAPQPLPAGERALTLRMRHLRDWREWGRLCAALRARAPAAVHSHLRYAALWGAAAAHRLRLPHVITLHQLPGAAAGAREWTLRRLECRALAAADRVLFVSAAQQAAWSRAGTSAARWRAMVLPNGVPGIAPWRPGERSAWRHRLGLPAGAVLFVTVAVVRAAKGWRTWLEACRRIALHAPQACCVWVGAGPDFAAFQAAARDAPPRIRLIGARGDVPDWLRGADAFLFPSREEALPTAVLEALAAGLPIVASRLPAIAESLGDAGCMVVPGDPCALAEAALAACRPETRAAWSAAARRRWEAEYCEERWHARLLALYAELGDRRAA